MTLTHNACLQVSFNSFRGVDSESDRQDAEQLTVIFQPPAFKLQLLQRGFLFFRHSQEHSIMAHMGLGSGTAHIFDEVDKSDFKSDFGSEFPVGSTFGSHWQLTHHSPLPHPACLHPFVSCLVCWNDSLVMAMSPSLSHLLACGCSVSGQPHCWSALPPLKRLQS